MIDQAATEVCRSIVDERATPAVVGIVGMGYVGLPTALATAASGVSVIGFDVSEERLAAIKTGRVDLIPADHERLRCLAGSELLRLTADPASLAEADVIIVCVPTPVDKHLVPDLTPVRSACATVVEGAVPGQTIILTSTTYVGTTRDLLATPLAARGLRVGEEVFVAFSPERIDPGNSVHPQDRVPRVVGGVGPESARRAAAAIRLTAPVVHEVSSPEVAEMSKLLENTFRAVNIAMINEFADAARELGVDVTEVIAAASSKPYGFMPFHPGPGVGGHCIPCDPHYLLWQLRGVGRLPLPVIESAMTDIAARPRTVVSRARELLGEAGRPLAEAKVLLVGVAYKPGVADVRESPALTIMEELTRAGAQAAFYDPLVELIRVGGRDLVSLVDPAATDWDLVIVHTLHPGVDHGWIADCPTVLDATYRLTSVPHRHNL